MSTMTNRRTAIEQQAEEIAISLIKNGLTHHDPRYHELCERLARFRPLLEKHSSKDDEAARRMIRNGFKAVKLQLDPHANDDVEVLRLLNALVDKLSGMAKMLGMFK